MTCFMLKLFCSIVVNYQLLNSGARTRFFDAVLKVILIKPKKVIASGVSTGRLWEAEPLQVQCF